MAIIEKLKQFATGKTAIERKQEMAANTIIRQKARAAAFRERETQAIKFAQERERFIASERLKKLKQPRKSFTPMSSGFGGSAFDILGAGSKKSKKQSYYKII